jgi:type IV pilus assembly protein PilE
MEKSKLVSANYARLRLRGTGGFSMVELMVVLVIIGILVLLALPRLEPVVSKAKETEAKLMLKQVYTLEKSYKYENDVYSNSLSNIGFEQDSLVTEGGRARYRISILSADANGFVAEATAVVDFNGNGRFNVWAVDQSGNIVEKVPD